LAGAAKGVLDQLARGGVHGQQHLAQEVAHVAVQVDEQRRVGRAHAGGVALELRAVEAARAVEALLLAADQLARELAVQVDLQAAVEAHQAEHVLHRAELEQAAEEGRREVLALRVGELALEAQVLEQLAHVDVDLDLVRARVALAGLDEVVCSWRSGAASLVLLVLELVGLLDQLGLGGR
jgi:hypothetical protein